MTTVREAVFEMLRERGMTTVFGNPGSTDCVLGEGSAQYAITGFWTAVAYEVPVTFLVLRNEEYAILKWFGQLEDLEGAPGLDLPALDTTAVARGYGMHAEVADGREDLREKLREAMAAEEPRLVEVQVAPGMALA